MTDAPDSGVAGGSAQREYERRKAKDEARVRDTWGQGKLGTIAVALSSERQSTTAWRSGANGEAEVGRVLEKAASAAVRVLHDRRIPGSRANIDHIVVSPGGVWVIDAKRYKDKRPALRVDGGILRPRVEVLLVGGRDQTKLVDGVVGQVERVKEIVGDVPVRGVLCFVDAEWPLFGGEFTVRGVEILWPKLLLKRVTTPAAATHDVEATFAAIARTLPPAVR